MSHPTNPPPRRCSVCDQPFVVENPQLLPFCSVRCQQVDLGRWLDERYGLPYESPERMDEPLSLESEE